MWIFRMLVGNVGVGIVCAKMELGWTMQIGLTLIIMALVIGEAE